MSTVPTIKFPPSAAQARPTDTGLSAAQAFQTNRSNLRQAQQTILTISQELAEVDNHDDDFNPNDNEVTVVGRTTRASMPPSAKYGSLRNGDQTVDAEVRYGSDGQLNYFNSQQKASEHPEYPVSIKFERKEIKHGIPFINRKKETVQQYTYTDPLGTAFRLQLNEKTGVLTTQFS